MPFITSSDGVRLSYELVGEGAPLLLHLGAGCDSSLWRAAGYLEPLARDYRCILFDHRGHGESDHPRDAAAYHVDRFAADVLTLLDELDLGSASFWAYSNGIAVGLRAADQQPKRLRSLIGSGVIGRAVGEQQLKSLVTSTIANYREHGWEKLIAGFEQQEGPVPEWMKQRIRATDLDPVIGWSKTRLAWNWSAWEALPCIPTPALFLVGEHEDPDDVMAEAAALMPDGRRVRIPDKGHINGFLDSDFVLPRILGFLAENGQAEGQ